MALWHQISPGTSSATQAPGAFQPLSLPTPTPLPAVVSDRNQNRLQGAPTPPKFQGFQPVDVSTLPLDPVTSLVLVGRVTSVPLTLDELTARVRRLRMVSRRNLSQESSGNNRRIQVLPGINAASESEALMLTALITPAFDHMVETVVTEQIATSFGLQRLPVDMRAMIADVNKVRPSGWRLEDEVLAAGRSMEDLRNDLETQDLDRRLVERLMATHVPPATPGQILEYLRRPDTLTSKTRVIVRARHVAIPLEPDASPNRVERAQRIAEMARSALMSGTSWTVVVGRYSFDNLTRGQGGDLGWLATEDLEPELRDAITSMPIQGPPQVVRTTKAFHVIQVTDRQVGDAQIHWRRAEAYRILKDMRMEFRRRHSVERYLP